MVGELDDVDGAVELLRAEAAAAGALRAFAVDDRQHFAGGAGGARPFPLMVNSFFPVGGGRTSCQSIFAVGTL